MVKDVMQVGKLIKILDLQQKHEENKGKLRRIEFEYNDCRKKLFQNENYCLSLFASEPCKILTWNDLLGVNYNREIINHIPRHFFFTTLILHKEKHDSLFSCRRETESIYKNYCKNLIDTTNDLRSILGEEEFKKPQYAVFKEKINFSPGTKHPSTCESLIMQFLDKLAKKYHFVYFYRYKWPFIKHKNTLEYDFYCAMPYYNRVIHWVIEFDGVQHHENCSVFDFKSNHMHDILKQYYLLHLNIHLLRLNNNSNIKEEIVKFINTILRCHHYVIVNKIEPITKYFTSKTLHSGLKFFYDYCMQNYNRVSKTKSKIPTYMFDDDDDNIKCIKVSKIDAVKIPDDCFIDVEIIDDVPYTGATLNRSQVIETCQRMYDRQKSQADEMSPDS